MKQFWITFFGSIFGVIIGSVLTVILVIFMIGGLVGAAMQGAQTETTLPQSGIVLELDLRSARIDSPSGSPFAFAETLSVVDLVRTLERAEADESVQGLFIRANEFGMSPAMAEEIRTAIADFRAAGKFVVTHAQGFEGTSVTGYFAVAGSDEIWLQDTASFTAAGLAAEVTFLGGLFERFDAVPQFEQFHEYKNAADTYTQTEFTEAHREATLSYMTSIYDTAVSEISGDRRLTDPQVRAVFETAPHTAESAAEQGLVDSLGHVVDAREAALTRAGELSQFVDIAQYHLEIGQWSNDPVVALIEGQGAIVTGSAEQGPFGGSEAIGSDVMSDAILAAANDNSVRAILIRIDSPGGSAIASDQVWDAIIRAQDAGKPVIVSMASVAASGGYYIAAPADYVLANATTITGSIGVLGGKVVLDGTFNLVGLNTERIAVGGEYATAFSSQVEWTETQRAAYRDQMANIYEDFTQRVADGRDLPLERVLEIARGRVWTGAQAIDIGLVDEIGGFRAAVEAAKELAGIEPESGVQLRRFPNELTPIEAFSAMFGLSAETAETAARLNALMELPEVRAAIEARETVGDGRAQLRSRAPQPH
jgi:protease-4